MADSPQSYKSHRRFLPLHHFVVTPILLANVAVEAARLNKYQTPYHVWMVVVAMALLVFAFMARSMAVTAQDRVIRLEEQLRLQRLMPVEEHATIGALEPRHMVGLRFASDEEAPDLARRAATGEFKTADEIKKQVKNWKADNLRV